MSELVQLFSTPVSPNSNRVYKGRILRNPRGTCFVYLTRVLDYYPDDNKVLATFRKWPWRSHEDTVLAACRWLEEWRSQEVRLGELAKEYMASA